MLSRSALDRASRSGFATISTSPSRAKSIVRSNSARAATLDTCSEKIFSAPATVRSRTWASRPATCSTVLVRE